MDIQMDLDVNTLPFAIVPFRRRFSGRFAGGWLDHHGFFCGFLDWLVLDFCWSAWSYQL